MLKTFILDQDVDLSREVSKYYSSSSSIAVSNFNYIEDIIKNINDCDVLILDLLINDMGSFKILSKLSEMKINKKVIATSEYITPDMISALDKYHVNYFIKKPYSMETLNNVLKNMDIKSIPLDNDLKLEITNLLHLLGIPSHIKGYTYIRDSVALLYKDSSLVGAITKELYPTIAANYATTSSRVERAIRHAIEVSWLRGDYNLMEEIFGNSVDFDRSKPTNSEFIVTLADRLKLKNKYA